jgi:hypothetical protein
VPLVINKHVVVHVALQGILLLTASSMIPDSDEDAEKANPLQVRDREWGTESEGQRASNRE